jgi:multidrug efflux pump subunit AcrB
MLKNWDERGKGESLEHVERSLLQQLASVQEAGTRVLIPPPIQGLGASSGFQMQVELTDGNLDFTRLQRATDQIVHEANKAPSIQNSFTAFRASVPQLSLTLDSAQAATLNLNVGDVYNALQSYMGSTFVNLFTRFGRNYMVYVQADPAHRLTTDDLKELFVRNQTSNMVPVGAIADLKLASGPSVVSLYKGRMLVLVRPWRRWRASHAGFFRRACTMNGPLWPTRRNWSGVPPISFLRCQFSWSTSRSRANTRVGLLLRRSSSPCPWHYSAPWRRS